MATPNTVLADINEIYTGYVLNNNKWYSTEAKVQYNKRVKEAQPDEVADAIGKAKVMAIEFLKWAKAHGYRGGVRGVWWTARPNSMSSAFGEPVDQKKNPTDILIQFATGHGPGKGFLGLSAKATKGKGDIGFKNPGIGTVDRNLGLKMAEAYKKELKRTVEKLDLPQTDSKRKLYIRENSGIKVHTERIGVQILSKMREVLFIKLQKMKQPALRKYLLSDWMDAEVLVPPYIKVTGKGNKAPYSAAVMDPINNPKLAAISAHEIKLEKVGNESIGVCAGNKRIMKIRFKFESEKMASSLKLSGDPW